MGADWFEDWQVALLLSLLFAIFVLIILFLIDQDKIAKEDAEYGAVQYHKDGESYQEYGAQGAQAVVFSF